MHRFACLASALIVLVLAAPAAADTSLPVGHADGVRIAKGKRGFVVVFGPQAQRLWQRVAGRHVFVSCDELPGQDGSSGGAAMGLQAPRHGRRLGPVLSRDEYDYCRVWRSRRIATRNRVRFTRTGKPLVSIPVTQRGAAYLADERTAWDLFGVLTIAQRELLRDGIPLFETPEALLNRAHSRPHGVVALASPADTPPVGAMGYFSDGQQHAAVVEVAATGRRLFIEVDADEVFKTNVLRFLLDEDLAETG